MAELATIARPYAEALFKAGKADLNATSAWVDALAGIADNAQLQQFASNPKTTNQQIFDLITSVCKSELPEQGKNFLQTVIENGRLSVLSEIAVLYRKLRNEQTGISDATVFSAFPINADALADIAITLEKRFGRKLNLQVKINEDLIGGIRVVVGDEVLDTSVKARLEQMKVALMA